MRHFFFHIISHSLFPILESQLLTHSVSLVVLFHSVYSVYVLNSISFKQLDVQKTFVQITFDSKTIQKVIQCDFASIQSAYFNNIIIEQIGKGTTECTGNRDDN